MLSERHSTPQKKKMTAPAICFVHKKRRCLKANLYEEENSLMWLINFI